MNSEKSLAEPSSTNPARNPVKSSACASWPKSFRIRPDESHYLANVGIDLEAEEPLRIPANSTTERLNRRPILRRLFVVLGTAVILSNPLSATDKPPQTVEPRTVALWPANSFSTPEKGSAPTLEIFYPFTTPALNATIVILPGGGYAGLSSYERRQAEYFRALGYTAVVVNYRVQPYRHPAAYADVMRALRLLRYNAEDWSVPAERIVLLGGSAGGHLAALVTTRPKLTPDPADDLAEMVAPRIDQLILLYPVILTTGPAAHASIIRLLGPDASLALKESLSPDRFVDRSGPPVLIFHAADDDVVPVENSLAFARAYWAAGASAELHVFPHGGHGKSFAYDPEIGPRWREIARQWLELTATPASRD